MSALLRVLRMMSRGPEGAVPGSRVHR
jgi:hypothetical protein